MGYAVMMARSHSGLVNPSIWATLWGLLLYIVVQCAVTAFVFMAPWTVHQLDAVKTQAPQEAPASNAEVEQLMRDMADQANTDGGRTP